MTGWIGTARLLTLAALAVAGQRTSIAADWSETLEGNANAAYVTNPQLIPGSHIADRSAALAVDGSTAVTTERSRLSVTPRFVMTRYQRGTGLDNETGSVDFSFLRKLERGQWTLSAQSLTDSTVNSELGLTGITGVNFRHYADTLSAGYGYFSAERLLWQLQGSWQGTRYTADAQRFGLTDYAYASVQFGPAWNLSERLLGSINLETDRITPKNGTTEKDYSARLQLKRDLSARSAWRASVGATRVDSGRAGSVTRSVLEVGASRQGERFQWDLSVKRAVLPVGLGLLTRQDTAALAASLNTSERSTLTLSLNVIRSDPVTYFIYLNPLISLRYLVYSGASWGQASAEWRYRLSRRWALSAAYVQARARNGSLPQWANRDQARLGVVWQSGRL